MVWMSLPVKQSKKFPRNLPIRVKALNLRVLPPILDPALKAYNFRTDDARPYPLIHDDSILADFAPISDSHEQLNIKTSNAIDFHYRRAEVS